MILAKRISSLLGVFLKAILLFAGINSSMLGWAGESSPVVRCLGPFIIESKQSYSLSDFNGAKKGKVSFGIYRKLKSYKNSTVAYTTIDRSDPIFEEMNDALNRGVEFEACVEDRVAKEFEKYASCKNCTARGEIQGDIKVFSIIISRVGGIKR